MLDKIGFFLKKNTTDQFAIIESTFKKDVRFSLILSQNML
jgi:hypothetical protein